VFFTVKLLPGKYLCYSVPEWASSFCSCCSKYLKAHYFTYRARWGWATTSNLYT